MLCSMFYVSKKNKTERGRLSQSGLRKSQHPRENEEPSACEMCVFIFSCSSPEGNYPPTVIKGLHSLQHTHTV